MSTKGGTLKKLLIIPPIFGSMMSSRVPLLMELAVVEAGEEALNPQYGIAPVDVV